MALVTVNVSSCLEATPVQIFCTKFETLNVVGAKYLADGTKYFMRTGHDCYKSTKAHYKSLLYVICFNQLS